MKTGYSYLYEKIDEMPQELRSVVLDFDFTHAFDTLVSKYKLHYDQSEIVQNLTFRLMFEEISPSDFTQGLVSSASLAPVTAKELVDDINISIISALKHLIMEKVKEVTDMYETDENYFEEPTPSPQEFHPKSAYNEPITNDTPIHHIVPIKETKMTHSEVLHGIENPHPSIGGNSPIRTASGSKSYSDIMTASTTVKPVYPEVPKEPVVKIKPIPQPAPVVEIKPSPAPEPSKPAPSLQQKVDLIAMKSSAVVVSAPNKIEALPAKPAENLPVVTEVKAVDPYKETI